MVPALIGFLGAEAGGLRRARNPQQLMAYLGLVPSECSSGKKVTRGRITMAGNSHDRWVLVEGAWTYRMQARVSSVLYARLDGLPREVREIAWKAQVRLYGRYRRSAARRKPKNFVTTEIAREMAAFAWAIAQRVEPAPAASNRSVRINRSPHLEMRLARYGKHWFSVQAVTPGWPRSVQSREETREGPGQCWGLRQPEIAPYPP